LYAKKNVAKRKNFFRKEGKIIPDMTQRRKKKGKGYRIKQKKNPRRDETVPPVSRAPLRVVIALERGRSYS